MEQYKKLSSFYHDKWGDRLIEPYLKIINVMLQKYSVNGKTVLDIACGTANILGRLSQEGYLCTGTDLSKYMIEEAKNRYSTIDFSVQNMKDVSLNKDFDLILNTFNSVNYLLKVDELANMFISVHNLLSNNGIFIIDFSTDVLYTTNYEGEHLLNVSGVDFKQVCTYDRKERIATSKFIFSKNEIETHRQKAYFYNEIENTIINSNLKVVDSFGNFDMSPLTEKSLRYIFVVKKNNISSK